MNREGLLIFAINTWGEEAQVRMAVEECSELIKAICKLARGGSADDVIEEIADVQIMIDQLKLIFGTEPVLKVEGEKLQRLERRLNKRSDAEEATP